MVHLSKDSRCLSLAKLQTSVILAGTPREAITEDLARSHRIKVKTSEQTSSSRMETNNNNLDQKRLAVRLITEIRDSRIKTRR